MDGTTGTGLIRIVEITVSLKMIKQRTDETSRCVNKNY